ncbi:MAG: bifunctional (p)ppGpp synthetase/guanosine-3',5'-bis(diphosphate) 3'-pyrophosphohydrolase [Muribaculaceae bacterium]|nr:bifunctional (p)ppGpp synthetase/guanosine-3',5'-bis(diphosphate) 3'-pyrophosphohydrolase [Muribaculaceae bacterium]
MEIKQPYFTHEERQELLRLVKELHDKLGRQLSRQDIDTVHRLIHDGITVAGIFKRDQYGLNPVLRHLRTANALCDSIAPDRTMVIATMIYNLCRGDYLTVDKVRALFGNDIATIVHGLLHIVPLYKKQAAVENENFHKLLLSFAEDVRVILIMTVDRLALMRFINHHPNQKFVHEIASESRYLYAPLAHKLGLYAIKNELEDISLKYLDRKVFDQIANRLQETKEARDRYVQDFIKPIKERLEQEGLKFELKGRTKSINSIWQKMQKQGVDLSGIYDLFAIRIILDTTPKDEKRACWLAYSIVTDIYKANPSRFKDWITIPKSNGYESLHITVYGPDNRWVEVQIRSRRMDETAERGVAAHWRYKGVKSDGDVDKWMNEVREMLEASGREGQMSLMRNMDTNLYNNEVFVFTPKGDLIRLPQGATILDFAFHIHSRVGSTCMGGKVDGKNQKINYRLRSGDTVEIITSNTQTPRLDWLNIAVTSRARNKIKNAINERKARQAQLARETLQRRFKNRKIEPDDATLARVIKRMGYKTSTEFFAAIQEDVIDVNTVVEQYEDLIAKKDETTSRGTAEEFVLQPPTPADERQHNNDDILTIGDDVKGVNYKLARCCNPIFGDRITGFIASDGAIKIHRNDCKNLRHLSERYPYRIIRTRWTGKAGSQFVATLKVLGRDDIGIVSSITSVINKTDNCLLRSISVQAESGLFEGVLSVNISDITLLDDLVKKIQGVKGVKQVERM